MRHHHELSLTRVMELRPDQLRHHHEISPRSSWNYALTNEAPPRNYRGNTTYKSCFTIQTGAHRLSDDNLHLRAENHNTWGTRLLQGTLTVITKNQTREEEYELTNHLREQKRGRAKLESD
ncbi:hypothetical protein DEO72_LG6g2198 [Vigna unguiculata]|uniref:Uncharacterized protein n=1 Tax=Vigna unguiculata TaxID=3917 RepID=A0A4D6MAR0_VIGUN|nr:hypothetical protein DEO72_LG6g2198 [Vigna unguiculata]